MVNVTPTYLGDVIISLIKILIRCFEIGLISLLKFSFKFPYESRQSFYLLKKKKKWEIKRSEFRGHGKLEKTIFAGDWGVFRVRVRAVKNGSITVFPCAHVHKHERVGERFSASWPGPSFGDSQEKERRKGRERKRERENGTRRPLFSSSFSPFLFFGEHCRPVRLDSRRIKF